MTDSNEPPVQAVLNAMVALEVLGRSGRDMPLAEIAIATNTSKTTLHRILRTLVGAGYVSPGATDGTYRLGVRLVRFASYVRSSSELVNVARPVLERLVASAGETAMLGVADGTNLLYLDIEEPPQMVRLSRVPGGVGPLHCTALGKALLAYGEPDLVERVIAGGLGTPTAKAIRDADALRDELASVRERGYALNDQEHIEGVRAVGVPVFAGDGNCAAAMSLAGPAYRIDEDRVAQLVAMMINAADELSVLLGHHDDYQSRLRVRD